MSSQSSPPAPLHWKLPLASRTADVLRQKVREGTLTDPLPGENHLAADLGVSRSTVRDALKVLAQEGLIRVTKGKHSRLIAGVSKAKCRSHGLSVCVIRSFDSRLFEPFYGSILGQMRLYFAEAGLPWEQYFSLPSRNTMAFLDEVVSQRPKACWLLVGVSKLVQEYFEKHHKNALIVGTNYAGVALPAIDPDYRALAHHAGNLLLRRGCEQVITIMPKPLRAGDAITKETLAAIFAQHPKVRLIEEAASKNFRDDFQRLSDRVLRRLTPRTVVFCFHAEFVFALLSRAAQRGLKASRDFFLLSRDDHAYFSYYFPNVSRYAFRQELLQRQILRIVTRIQAGLPLPHGPHFITPELIEGETLPPLKANVSR